MSRSIHPQSLVLALAAVLSVTCGIADALAQNAQKVSLRLDWVTSGYHAPYFVGIKNGYYKEQGLERHHRAWKRLRQCGAGDRQRER